MFTQRRRLVVILGLVFIGLLLPVLSQAGFFYGKQKFYTIKSKHFYIHYPEGIGPIADTVRGIAEEQFTNISTRLNWKPKGRTHVVLTDKTDVANGLATVMPFNYIMLQVAHPTADSSLDVYKNYLTLLFAHEFTHIVHIDMNYRWAKPARLVMGKVVAPNGATPGWMREGMAVHEESQLDPGFGRSNSAYADMVLRTSVLEDKFPRIDQVAGSSRHFPGGAGPYLYGGKFFQWLADKYGEERMYKYQKLYSSGLWVFSLNNKARRVYGKSFYKLWKEFKADQTQKALAIKSQIEGQGLTSFDSVVKTKDTQKYYTPHPISGYAYFNGSMDEASKIIIEANGKSAEIKRALFGQMSFSKTGRYLAFSSLSSVEPKTTRSEVYYYDLEKKSLYRVYEKGLAKKSMRVRDPDFSSADGGQRWLVMVRKYLNTDQLYIYDLYEKRGYVVTNEPKSTQFSNPRFSPDGSKIVVSRKDANTGYRDIVVYSKKGEKLYQITNDIHNDNHPVFSKQGDSILFDSYRTGISNIFKYNIEKKTLAQMTNVLDGVFQPMPAQDGHHVYIQRYSSDKNYIQKFNGNRSSVLQSVSQVQSAVPLALSNMRGRNFSLHIPNDKNAQPVVVQHTIPHKNLPASDPKFLADPNTNVANALSAEHINHDQLESISHSLPKFARNPGDTDYLPGVLFSNWAKTLKSKKYHQDKNQKPPKKSKKDKTGKIDKTKIVKDTEENTPKIYPSAFKNELSGFPSTLEVDRSNPADAKKYSAFPQLLVPKYFLPNLIFFENAALIGATIGRNDPLFRHSWTAFANYRTDAKFAGGGATYVYSRYDPVFYTGFLRYAVDWGNVSTVTGGVASTTRFFEERTQAFAGTSFNIGRHRFNGTYFYEHRAALTNLNVNLVNMKPYAGLSFQYSVSNFKQYPNSISQESGFRLKIGGTWTDSYLGSDNVNEEKILHADARYYLKMPWSKHHVLALRAAGGTVWGDVQQFGVYRLGGPFGEGVGANVSARVYPLRGLAGITFGGDRVFIFSAEYRLPLVTNVNAGIGTMPIFLDKLSLAFFVDGGDIKFRNLNPDLFQRMMVSTGAELNAKVVVGYGLPLNMRLGYGILLTNRDRVGTLRDAVTRQSLKYGSVYFQLGTMF